MRATDERSELQRTGGPAEEGVAAETHQESIWEYFQNEAPDSFALSRPRVRYLARRIRRAQPGARVLDVGVGAGTFEEAALEEGLDVHCLDPSAATIELLRERFGLGEKAAVGYGQAIPHPDESLDWVVMTEVLEHLPTDVQESALREVRRVLRPGGRLLGTVPARENLESQRTVCPDCGARFHRWGHLHSFDADAVRALLATHFEVEHLEERSFALYPKRGGAFRRFKRAVKLALLQVRVLGPPPDTVSIVFQARRR